MHPTVVISSRGEERLRGGHPWIYRADVADVRAAAGDIVQVRSPRGQHARVRAVQRPIADRAPHADHTARRSADERADPAAARSGDRVSPSRSRSTRRAYRLVHGEADLLPSLIVDRYGDYLVVQTLSQGMDRLLPAVVVGARPSCCSRAAFSRATIRGRASLEGLEQRVDVRGRRGARSP